jgi:acetoacetyl-CoA synthetase
VLPVYSGEIQVKALGMSVNLCDPTTDEPIPVEHLGRVGQLTCTKPFPSQPIAFYGEDGFRDYLNAYFERFGSRIWAQDDLVRKELDTGGLVIFGNS